MRTKFLLIALTTLAIVAFSMPALADGPGGASASPILAILAAIPPDVIAAVLAGAVIFIMRSLHLKSVDRDRILTIAKGAYPVVARVASLTNTKLDDALAVFVKRVADELGRELSDEEHARVKGIALAMHVDPALPFLGNPTPDELARAINLPRS